jgi:AcrR family transcriptional regulator
MAKAPAARGRGSAPPPRVGDARGEIFAATERLLEEVSLHELSVAQILEEARVSRATFYFYFSSKHAVIAGLLARIMDEIYEVARPFIERAHDEPPQESLRRGLEATGALWQRHRLAMRAVSEHWHQVPELGQMWLEIFERFTGAFAAEIDRQREAGLAPAGVDSRRLAASLLWATERCFYVAGLGADEALGSEPETTEVLYPLWQGAIYGSASAARSRKPARRPGR